MNTNISPRCFWCNADPVEALKRDEAPHATWCPYFHSRFYAYEINLSDFAWPPPVKEKLERELVEGTSQREDKPLGILNWHSQEDEK